MVSAAGKIVMAILILALVTVAVYYAQIVRAYKRMPPTPIYIARPDWYVTDREWQKNIVLYDGSNYYYSDSSNPKTN